MNALPVVSVSIRLKQAIFCYAQGVDPKIERNLRPKGRKKVK